MCLAVPGRIIKREGDRATVDFGGTQREISVSLTPSVKPDDYVLVHAGFSIQALDPKEALETLKLFSEIYEDKK